MIASGNKKGTVLPIVQAQIDSLIKQGVDIVVYPVIGNGLLGYLKNLFSLFHFIKKENPDVVHAHYSLCGYMATLTTSKPTVVSIMGSFPTNSFKKKLVKWCIRNCWDTTIVKSERTAKQLNEQGLHIIPNGVDFEVFKYFNEEEARKICGLSENKKYVIFVSNPDRPEKNYALAEKSVNSLNNKNVELIPVYNMPHEKVAQYMVAADVLLMTSTQEGSPNVIKEAMACDCPIVSTDVGDVRWVLNGVEGCYVADTFEVDEISDLLKKALAFNKETKGRERLTKIGLDSETVAFKLIDIYKRLVK